MNGRDNKEPEWFGELKGSPVRVPGWTMDKIKRTEEKATATSARGQRAARRRRFVFAGLGGAAVLVAAILLAGPWTHPAKSDPNAALSPQPTPPAGTEMPPANASEEISPLPAGTDEEAIRLERKPGKLGDQLPFQSGEVVAITVKGPHEGEEVPVPQERLFVILQSLWWIDLPVAIIDGDAIHSPNVRKLVFSTEKRQYALLYDPDFNAFGLIDGGMRFLADDRVWMLMQSLTNPASPWAELDGILERARIELENTDKFIDEETETLDRDRFRVNGRDYVEWETQFKLLSSGRQFYDSLTGSIGLIQSMGEAVRPDVFKFGGTFVFATDANATPDGIAVGLTSAETLERLGEPNARTDTKWSYRMGDYLRFHLIFDAGKIRYMMLTMPA